MAKKTKAEKPRSPTMGDVVPNGSHSHSIYPYTPNPAGPVWLWGSRAKLFFDPLGNLTPSGNGQRVWWMAREGVVTLNADDPRVRMTIRNEIAVPIHKEQMSETA